MADKKLNEVTTVSTGTLNNVKNFLAVMNDGSIQQMSKEDMASVVGGLLPYASINNNGLMTINQYLKNGRALNQKGYIKLAETDNWYTHYSAIIAASSPMSNDGAIYAVDWRGGSLKKAIINGSDVYGNIKFYIGKNGSIYELWIGLLGNDGRISEVATNGVGFSKELTKVDELPSYLSEA